MLLGKIILIAVAVVIFSLIIYLNRSYAHIYSYNEIISDPVFQTAYKFDGEKGEKEIKYLALGDSLTYGTGASDYKYSFPYIFSQKLSEKYKKVEVVNLAVPGATADDVLMTQLPRTLKEKPDLVTLMIGTNDVHNYTDIKQFGITFESIIDKLKENNLAEIIVINIPYLGTESLIVFPYNYLMDNRIKEFNKIILEITSTKNVKHIDLYTESLQEFKKNPGFYSKDNFHPSDSGYIFWGDLINAD